MSRTWCPSTSSRCRPPPCARILFVFIILRHDRRRIVHFNVTEHPSAEWTAQQILMLFRGIRRRVTCCETGMECYGPYETARCGTRVIEQVPTAPRSPWRAPTSNESLEAFGASVSNVIILDERHDQANPARIRRLLSFLPDSFIARERCPRATTCAVAFDGARDSHSEGRRPPSLLQSSRCLSSLRLTRCPWDTSRGVLGRASIPRSP